MAIIANIFYYPFTDTDWSIFGRATLLRLFVRSWIIFLPKRILLQGETIILIIITWRFWYVCISKINKSVFYLQYYCGTCWIKYHRVMDPSTGVHNPVMRNSKNNVASAATYRKLPEVDSLRLRPAQPYVDNCRPLHPSHAI